MERESQVYRALSTIGTTTTRWAPAFLGHLVENGRVMGMLIEKVEGRSAGIEDYGACEEVVRRFHERGFVHGDFNRYNFLVNEGMGEGEVRVKLIDFENTEVYDASVAKRELEWLREQLREETGRGGPALPM